MMLPDKYSYLLNDDVPRIVKEFVKLYGIEEYKGDDNNPIIIHWAQEISEYVGIDYRADSMPWCGLVMGLVAQRAGFRPPRICVRAKEWLKFGWEAERAGVGSVLIFNRSGGGHVGLYVGEDKYYYHVIGGNQNDKVSIARLEKRRCIGIRECQWKIRKPSGAVPVFLDSEGEVSRSEA